MFVAEGPPGCAGMLNQKPKWVEPAATLFMKELRGFTIQKEALKEGYLVILCGILSYKLLLNVGKELDEIILLYKI